MKQWLVSLLVLTLAAPLAVADGTPTSIDFRKVIRGAKDKVFPAVVFIKVIQETMEGGKKSSQEVQGSGVIVSSRGEVLTNWHVVDKAVRVRCLLYDGRPMKAKVVGSDKDVDLALIQLELADDARPLPFAALGDSSKLTEGDFVMAMGAPWGLSRSVSLGIISCTRRFLPGSSEYSLWLQTDASISPGNSGGPLVDTKGRIIGINTRGVMRAGTVGFAIPSTTIRTILPRLRKGDVGWSWTGLQLQPLRDFNKDTYFDGDTGVIVAGTDPESPARRAGLRPQDRIVSLDGKPLTARTEEDLPAVRQRLGLLARGKPVALRIMRGGKAIEARLTPRGKGAVEGKSLDCPRFDFTVKTINQFDNPDLHFHRKTGVFVYGIKSPGNANTSGLRRNDILLKIDGKPVRTLIDVKKVHKACMANIEKRHRVVISVLRGGLLRQVVLDFSRDHERN